MGLPQISIEFFQKAASMIARSSQGVVAIVIKDDTTTTFNIKEYGDISDFETGDFTAENDEIIKRAFLLPLNKLIVCRIGTTDEITVAMDALKNKVFDWTCVVSDVAQEQDDYASWIKSRNQTATRKAKLLGYKLTTSDDMHIVNFTNDSVKIKNDEAVTPGHEYLTRLVSVLAYLAIDQSSTYYVLDDLESVTEVADSNTAIDNGEFVLINDEEKVRIGRGVNSLTTLSDNQTEDMKSILIVEAMDLIYYDIYQTYKNQYLGKYKNGYDNQVLFISAVNGYFKDLAKENVLDENYKNVSFVDVEAQRDAWIAAGKTEAKDWDEQEVKNNTFKNKLFLAANTKILDAMEDLSFNINMA